MVPASAPNKDAAEDADMSRQWCLAISLATLSVALPAMAQDYPSKPIRVIASSAAGGISDIFMRTAGEELTRRWGQPIVIENRAGGGMNIGGRACAEAPPDGYTICILSNEVVTYNQYLYKNPGFDAEKSISPVTNLFFLTQALVVNSSLKVRSLSELAALSKAKPGTLSYSAPAAPLALFLDNFNKETGADLVRVPFKGGGDAVNGVLSGATPITFLGVGNLLSHLQSGTMIGLVVDGDERSPLFPDIPTLREIGYRGPLTRSYFALYAPMGMPGDFIAKIAAAVRQVANDKGFRDKHLVARGLEPVLDTPDAFAQFLARDRAEAQRVVKDARLQPQ
jgi:tripartite-type tricarboxylate transporter receptor subunit TctC